MKIFRFMTQDSKCLVGPDSFWHHFKFLGLFSSSERTSDSHTACIFSALLTKYPNKPWSPLFPPGGLPGIGLGMDEWGQTTPTHSGVLLGLRRVGHPIPSFLLNLLRVYGMKFSQSSRTSFSKEVLEKKGLLKNKESIVLFLSNMKTSMKGR